MDYSLPADLWNSVIPLSLVIGAIGGLVWDIGNAVRRSDTDPKTGIDNKLEMPRFYKDSGGGRVFELGLVGPLAVGAAAGVLLVLLVGPAAPSAEEAAKAVVAVGTASPPDSPSASPAPAPAEPKAAPGKAPGEAGQQAGPEPSPEPGDGGSPASLTPQQAEKTAEKNLTSKLGATQLVLLALLGGLGGWALLQSLTTRMSSLLEAAVGKAYGPASEAGAAAVQKAAEQLGLDEAKQRALGEAAVEGFKEAATAGIRQGAVEPPVEKGGNL